MRRRERYFVVGLTEKDPRPSSGADFEIQILGDEGASERIAYFSYSSNETVAILHAIGAVFVTGEHPVPAPVVEKCRHRPNSPGYYMDEEGEVVLPSFFEPTKAMLEEEQKRLRQRNN